LKNLTTKPSFFFLAYQGIMFLIIIIVGWSISGIDYLINQKYNIYEYFIDFLFFTTTLIPFVIFYTFILYFVFKNKEVLLNTFFIFFNSIIYGIIYLYNVINIPTKTGAGIFWLIIIPIFIATFVFFTIIPYCTLFLLEKNKGKSIDKAPYNKNKLYLSITIIGIIMYIFTGFTVFYTTAKFLMDFN